MKTLIIIPARYGSTRLPGKPLALIAGQTMLQRVVRIAQAASRGYSQVQVLVATDDSRITDHCEKLNVAWMMTPTDCQTGTDRAAWVIQQLKEKPDFVINMQGDAPLTPPDFLKALIDSYASSPCDMLTPVSQMTWEQLDKLRANKKATPFSGTTAVFNPETGLAYWFSKQIIPAIRQEEKLRKLSALSPIFKHLGLYGYSVKMLESFVKLPAGYFEQLEGLEQLRVLEHGFKIRCIPVDYQNRASMSGVDSPEDIARAEALIAEYGELVL